MFDAYLRYVFFTGSCGRSTGARKEIGLPAFWSVILVFDILCPFNDTRSVPWYSPSMVEGYRNWKPGGNFTVPIGDYRWSLLRFQIFPISTGVVASCTLLPNCITHQAQLWFKMDSIYLYHIFRRQSYHNAIILSCSNFYKSHDFLSWSLRTSSDSHELCWTCKPVRPQVF